MEVIHPGDRSTSQSHRINGENSGLRHWLVCFAPPHSGGRMNKHRYIFRYPHEPCVGRPAEICSPIVGEDNRAAKKTCARAEQCRRLRRTGSCKVGMDEFTNVREDYFSASTRGKDVREILSELKQPASNMHPCAYTFNCTTRPFEYVKHSGTRQTRRCYPEKPWDFLPPPRGSGSA